MENKDRLMQFLEELAKEGYTPWQVNLYLITKQITTTDWLYIGVAMGTIERLLSKYLTDTERQFIVGIAKETEQDNPL